MALKLKKWSGKTPVDERLNVPAQTLQVTFFNSLGGRWGRVALDGRVGSAVAEPCELDVLVVFCVGSGVLNCGRDTFLVFAIANVERIWGK